MHPILALLTAGLLSIHQYIPVDNTKYIKYFDDVRRLEAVNIFSAANQSCLYLKSVFINVGLEQTLGESLLNNSFGNILREELEEDLIFQSVVDILKSSSYSNKLKSYNLDVETAIQFINSICRKDFSLVDFSFFDRQAVLDIIKNEINILSPADLNSLGNFFYFGSIPVLSRRGQILASLNTNYRKWISYNEIPNHLILALLAAEDRRFFIHDGADEIAIARMAKMIIGSQRATGGSTLTMQLLKNMYFSNRSSKNPLFKRDKGALLLRKVREWYWAKPFEKYFYRESAPLSSKKKVLEYYFNLIGFGNNIQGVEQASQIYFSKPVQDLSLAEASYIVLLLKAPQRYSNPSNYDDFTKGRRDYVLNRIVGLCSEIHLSQFLTDKKEIKSLMQNLCSDGEQKIDSRYIERVKQTKLPLWEPPGFLDVDDSVIPIKRQIRRVLNTIKFQSSAGSKELTVQTSIDENLQKILFQVMKGYLDEHDQKHDQLSHVKPIKDSAGRQMLILPEDSHFLTYHIEGFLSSFEGEKRKWLYNVRLNPKPSFDSNSFKADSAEEFFKGFSLLSGQDIENVIQDIQKELLKRSGQVGSILFVELQPDHFSIFTLDQMLEKLRLQSKESESSVNKINQLIDILSVRKIQEKLYKNALSRIYKLRPRDDLEPVLYLGGDAVINRYFEKASLTPAGYRWIKRYKSGDFFWTKKQGGAYTLQGKKLQASALIMNSNTGEILASFDGYNLKNNYFYRSTQAQRQIGSLIKPFIYLYALDRESFDLQTTLNNHSVVIPVSSSQNYTPKNVSDRYLGPLAFIQSFIHSQNIATVSLIQNPNWSNGHWRDHLNKLMIFFKSAGLYKNYNDRNLYPSLLLGAKEESLSQMVSSFSFFANGLYSANPYFIKQIKNYKDSVIYESNAYNYAPSLERGDSLFQIRSLLLQTANIGTIGQLNNFVYNLEGGGYRAVCYNNLLSANHQACFGGKTGTSDNGEDIWFIGFSRNFVIGLWMGYDVKSPIGWNSSKLSSVFQSIVERGIDYLPPIEPVMSPSDKPRHFEKRQVFGSRACSRPVSDNESSYVIYTDRDSSDDPCGAEYFSQNKPDEEEGGGSCRCLRAKEVEVNSTGQKINEVLGYTLDIIYQGQLYENQGFYKTLTECERGKSSYFTEESGMRMCR